MPILKRPFGSWIYSIAIIAFCTMVVSPALAQTEPAAADEVKPGEEIFQVVAASSHLKLVHLDSRVLELANRIKIVDGFNAQVLSVEALSAHRVRIHADNPGVTTVKLIDEFDNVHTIEIFIEPDTRELQAYLERLFPGTAIEVIGLRDGVVLKGWVTDPTQIPQIIGIAEQFYPTVQSQMQVGGVSQVQLHVKVLEIQRTKIRELGFNFLTLGQQYALASTIGGVAPNPFPEATFGGPGAAASIAAENAELSFAITGSSDIFQGFIKALQTEALAKVLAEPVLVTTSGRPASMLSGGEFPVLVPQGVGATSIEWREFGVRMEAVPIVLGNGRLRLDIAPEVSARDVSNAVNVNGFVVPGLSVRRVNTQVEMRFGETLMIGGLISTLRTGNTSKVPFLGELPWIGAAFSRKSYNEGETELLILVTPQLAGAMAPSQVPPGGPGLNTDIPVDSELYFDGLLEVPMYGPDCGEYGCPDPMLPASAMPLPMHSPVPPGPVMPTTSRQTGRQRIQQVDATATPRGSAEAAEFQFSTRAERPTRANARPAAPQSAKSQNFSRDEAKDYATLTEDGSRLGLIEP